MAFSRGGTDRPEMGTLPDKGTGHSKLCKDCRLRKSKLCRVLLSERSIGSFPARQRSYERDAVIYETGEMPGLLGVLKSGYLRKERLYGDGRRTIFGLSRPGEIIGRMPGLLSDLSVEAATDVVICCFEEDAVAKLMQGNERFRLELLFQAATLRDLQLDMIWLRGALNSRERVIAFLVMMTGFMPAEPQPNGGVIVSIDLSRRDWADMTNATMETISRTMTVLSASGLVKSMAPNRYKISDLERLAEMAGIRPPLKATTEPSSLS